MLNPSKARRSLAGVVVALTAALTLFGAWAYQACAVYDTSLLLPGDGGAEAEASVDPNACQHVSPPARPDSSSDTDAGITLIAAFRTIDIGLDSDASAPYGYDLDNVCTCPGPGSCVQPNGTKTCDDDAGGRTGRDNFSIQLFRAIGPASTTGTQQIDNALQAGQYGILLVIQDYNGQPDDPSVTVSYYNSNGVTRNAEGGITAPPKFNGNDEWTIDPTSLSTLPASPIADCSNLLAGECLSNAVDQSAYVTNRILVAHIPQLTMTFGDRSFLGGATMQLEDAIVVGQLQIMNLSPGNGSVGYAVGGGTIAGRWPTQQLLSTLATIPDPVPDGGFYCGDNITYQIIKNAVCTTADISQQMVNDNTNGPCNAVSVGMTFTAGPAGAIGGTLLVPPAPAGCFDGSTPFSDTCN